MEYCSDRESRREGIEVRGRLERGKEEQRKKIPTLLTSEKAKTKNKKTIILRIPYSSQICTPKLTTVFRCTYIHCDTIFFLICEF